GLCETHSPFRFPVELAGRHRPEAFAVPEVPERDLPRVPEVFRHLTRAQKQGIRAAYATAVEFLDSNVGRVLDALEESGRSSSTLVILSSDHGYLLGHHDRFKKHCGFEETIRITLLLHGPGIVPGRATHAFVSLIDVVPTLLELL